MFGKWKYMVPIGITAILVVAKFYDKGARKERSLRSVAQEELRLPRFGKVRRFQLYSQEGEAFDSASHLEGKVWVASFIFTRCQGPCPMMAQKMAGLQQHLFEKNDPTQLVSISMDPDYDTPFVLKAFGDKYAADYQRWTFLTGAKPTIIELAKEVFRVPAGEEPDMHSTRFILVDSESYIRGYYDAQSGAAELRKAIQQLSQEQPDVLATT
ncbi:MAG: SCO family protein [Zetaproteobacteria bacterium]|nr:SCO family protein [Zetaproteobacteria bacterium]